MQVTHQELEPLHIQLNITIEPDDYREELDQELRKYRSKSNLRGFRKGMAPLDVIKKMAGKQILSDIINKLVSGAFENYLQDQKLDIFLEPLPVEEVESQNKYSATQLHTYNFAFEAGIKPQFEVKGISDEDSYTEYEVEITDAIIDEELEHYRKDKGSRIEVDTIDDDKDFVRLKAVELVGDEVKEDGLATDFPILVSDIKQDKVKQALIGKKQGESIDIDIFELEDLSEENVYKYLLKTEKSEERPVNNMFRATIESIQRIVPVTLDESYFELLNDNNIKNIEDLKGAIKESYKQVNSDKAKDYIYREIMEYMVENTELNFPVSFFKKYLKQNNPEVSEEEINKDFESFLHNIKWITIKDKLINQFEIDVDEKEVERQMLQDTYELMQRYGMFDYNRFQEIVRNRMKNRDELRKAADKIVTNKMFDKIYSEVQKVSTTISMVDFNEKYKAMSERINKS